MLTAPPVTNFDPSLAPLVTPYCTGILCFRASSTTRATAARGVIPLELACAGREANSMSDATGRFLIAPTGDGHCKFEIDGGSGNRPGKSYGVYFAGVD